MAGVRPLHWLDTGNKVGGATWPLPFGEAPAVARSLGLATQKEWKVWCKEGMRLPNVPSTQTPPTRTPGGRSGGNG